MERFVCEITILGHVVAFDLSEGNFTLKCRSGDQFICLVGAGTQFLALTNLDELNRDRVPTPSGFVANDPPQEIKKYIRLGRLLAVRGVYQSFANNLPRFDARVVHFPHSDTGNLLFEDTHWWLTQITSLADAWLDDLFENRRTYEVDDFAALYRTNLNIIGLPTDDDIQECATLSRLIYGLSSAYLLTGSTRYLLAAKAGVDYQRETFRSISHDGSNCFWAFGRRKTKYGSSLLISSENSDDLGSIPLYEQIYCLAGMVQYYRITHNPEVFEDIKRSVNAFNSFYHDKTFSGYFSHIDCVTLKPDSPALGQNQSKKNWNSIGDHIPAYLINLILAFEPLPKNGSTMEAQFLSICKRMLDELSDLILGKFFDPESPYVNERFFQDWHPDHTWGWQQNRAIIGHNLKIAWNLTRLSGYYAQEGARSKDENAQNHCLRKAKDLLQAASHIAKTMIGNGIDQLRSGIFDAVERNHTPNHPFNFTWGSTKDFWQQEQAILAYLILHGHTGDAKFLALARELSFFWNLFFLDHANRGVYFRVTDNGLPFVDGLYANKAGPAIAGYHMFELNYLAHIYNRTYVTDNTSDKTFCLYFLPDPTCPYTSINVLPDFFPPRKVRITKVLVNGIPKKLTDPYDYQIKLNKSDLGCSLCVEFATH